MGSDSLLRVHARHWAASFDVCCILDTNAYPDGYGEYDLLIAAGAKESITCTAGTAFNSLKEFYKKNWVFGFLAYDMKNETEQLGSSNFDGLAFPDLFFFTPEYLLGWKGGTLHILIGPANLATTILEFPLMTPGPSSVNIQARLTKQEYIAQVNTIQKHIQKGDCYEVTFCQEFYDSGAVIDPLATYQRLNTISPAPFSAFFKKDQQFIISASPERYLSKRGNKLVSQPIKGTAKRSLKSDEDTLIKEKLKTDLKEQTENVMIVDLVRNDLTRCAVPGTVKVEELFGIYTFPQVHQMISTVSCQIAPELHPVDAIKNTFPMGSMTGAPKIKAMEIIEEVESSRRGVYSGAVGYINPQGNFDFNVVIRTILYNADKKYLSFHTGGAITYSSDPEAEYEECLLKGSAMIKTIKGLR